MAGRGPAPKDPHRRARRNVDTAPQIMLPFQSCDPPELPEEYDWHPVTLRWWATWQSSPMAQIMGPTDWDFLRDTARLHDAYWKGDLKLSAELRLRVAKYGCTPEDRLRLRIQWAEADEKDLQRTQGAHVPDRARYAQLRAVPSPSA